MLDFFFNRFSIIFSIPTNAPPTINNTFLVLNSVYSSTIFLLELSLTFAVVPSTSLNNACCTPSPLTSLVPVLDSLRLAFLSISSIKTIPLSAKSISKLARCTKRSKTLSASSPT
jgi:hypothetical protein